VIGRARGKRRPTFHIVVLAVLPGDRLDGVLIDEQGRVLARSVSTSRAWLKGDLTAAAGLASRQPSTYRLEEHTVPSTVPPDLLEAAGIPLAALDEPA
jgi:hypothetical protein